EGEGGDDKGSCGCRSASPAGGWAWLGLLALLGLRRRRRRG
ncbi:MAG: MYXO-CTERM sorting domain-containing protein, partial [Myxococcales bacterium]|nr:MYXO-CTERM sorting domain-containing protein [Myxococcales bacterium]